jgi:hypothetical protein
MMIGERPPEEKQRENRIYANAEKERLPKTTFGDPHYRWPQAAFAP